MPRASADSRGTGAVRPAQSADLVRPVPKPNVRGQLHEAPRRPLDAARFRGTFRRGATALRRRDESARWGGSFRTPGGAAISCRWSGAAVQLPAAGLAVPESAWPFSWARELHPPVWELPMSVGRG